MKNYVKLAIGVAAGAAVAAVHMCTGRAMQQRKFLRTVKGIMEDAVNSFK
ncbi:MAG: hypothetical protein GX061_06985 [Eubacteriaceae bacterium]|nr:hypothetical protein [Eubacteriaceae bacterium]